MRCSAFFVRRAGRPVLVAGLLALAAGCSAGSTTTGTGTLPSSAGHPSTTARTSTSARPRVTTVTVPRPAPVTRTVIPAGPSDRSGLLRALQASIPVDPNPFEGAYPNVYFETPSHNIGCYIFIDGGNRVECTIARYDFPQPGPDCADGAVLTIDSNGSPAYAGCSTYPLDGPDARVLHYGASVRNGDLECASSSIGLTCGEVEYGTGFFLSRQRFTPIT